VPFNETDVKLAQLLIKKVIYGPKTGSKNQANLLKRRGRSAAVFSCSFAGPKAPFQIRSLLLERGSTLPKGRRYMEEALPRIDHPEFLLIKAPWISCGRPRRERQVREYTAQMNHLMYGVLADMSVIALIS